MWFTDKNLSVWHEWKVDRDGWITSHCGSVKRPDQYGLDTRETFDGLADHEVCKSCSKQRPRPNRGWRPEARERAKARSEEKAKLRKEAKMKAHLELAERRRLAKVAKKNNQI
ncbi:hypothetical protein SEA_XENIA2_92 [Gordonia phage Xenia2]